MESQPCTQPACALPPVDCQVSQWAAWSACSATCGTSVTKSRTRTPTRAAENGGMPCPALMETTTCGLSCCPVACIVSHWSAWSACSATCGSGMRSRSRTATTDAACGGTPCPTLSDSEVCSVTAWPCARDCVLSAWATWSPCSVTCGGGRRERARTVTQAAVEPGMACPLDLTESEQCGAQVCTAPGLACSEYTACTDCTDNGKTSPRRCQFCGSADGVGMCQSLNMVDGDDSSGLRACAINFDQRATTIAQCSADVRTTAQATMTSDVIGTVDERSALNIDTGDTVAIAAPSADIALIAGIAGAIGALFIIAIIVTVVVCISRRRRNKNAPQSTPPQVAATAMDEFVSAREPASVAVRTHTYGNVQTQPQYLTSSHALSNPAAPNAHYNTFEGEI